eukprot:TRINITY_DN7000_c0_g2_i1.p1 TRINITY_DN7000_c0_g2~~TRINITY_DN7000_c0_g2_i1.p1  ORF type:complete len:648 (+),score=169.78 TRINITY_DN7000_c0_g2_i1:744-2687(+)
MYQQQPPPAQCASAVCPVVTLAVAPQVMQPRADVAQVLVALPPGVQQSTAALPAVLLASSAPVPQLPPATVAVQVPYASPAAAAPAAVAASSPPLAASELHARVAEEVCSLTDLTIKQLLRARQEAKARRDYGQADTIEASLRSHGIRCWDREKPPRWTAPDGRCGIIPYAPAPARSRWQCARCGFENRAINTVCGGTGPGYGCKAAREEVTSPVGASARTPMAVPPSGTAAVVDVVEREGTMVITSVPALAPGGRVADTIRRACGMPPGSRAIGLVTQRGPSVRLVPIPDPEDRQKVLALFGSWTVPWQALCDIAHVATSASSAAATIPAEPEERAAYERLLTLGSVHMGRSRFESAQAAFESLLQRLPHDHPVAQRVTVDLGSVLTHRGRAAAAVKLLSAREFPARDVVAAAKGELGRALWCVGDTRAASVALRDALRLAESAGFQPEHPTIINATHALALLLETDGDYAAAADSMERAYASALLTFGSSHYVTKERGGCLLRILCRLHPTHEATRRGLQMGFDMHAEPPASLSVTGDPAVAGQYHVVPEVRSPDGLPVWRRSDGDTYLYSGTSSRWMVWDSHARDLRFDCNDGCLESALPHGFAMPHVCEGGWHRWRGAAGWVLDDDVSVAAGAVVRGRSSQGY